MGSEMCIRDRPCLYHESSVYITVLRRMISALPGVVITPADWKSAVGTPRRDRDMSATVGM